MNTFSTKVYSILLFSILFIFAPLTITNASSLTDEVKDVPIDKEWKITFSHPVVESTVTAKTIYILDDDGTELSITPIPNGEMVTLPMPKDGYKEGHRYTLHITSSVMGQVGSIKKPLTTTIVKPFSTATDGYTVVKITSDGKNTVVGYYKTFNEADFHRNADEAIMYNNQYVKIPNGLVATNTSRVTIIYKEPKFTTDRYEYGGLAVDTEILYKDATEDYVIVEVAGQDMYVKHEDVTLIPSTLAKEKSYYIADHRGLWHHLYQHHKGAYEGRYLVGEKPSFLTEGVKYYSSNGANFFDESGNLVGESYAYFQFISPRVPTSYSAQELDAYIAKILKEKEDSKEVKYAKATTKSPLNRLGTTLKAIEQEKRLNALLILSLAIHESEYGMSCHAQNYNNIFGFRVTDSQNECSTTVDTSAGKYFDTIEENIDATVNWLNENYLNPQRIDIFQFNGLALGNKTIGMNVRYATDAYWGAKIAGHIYRIDKELGGKDYKQYRIGFTAKEPVSVRKGPSTSFERAYQYRLDGSIKRLGFMPITLSNTPSTTENWLRVVSELSHDATDLYTRADNFGLVETH